MTGEFGSRIHGDVATAPDARWGKTEAAAVSMINNEYTMPIIKARANPVRSMPDLRRVQETSRDAFALHEWVIGAVD